MTSLSHLQLERGSRATTVHPITLNSSARSNWRLLGKRLLDVVGAAVLLVLVSPIMAALALWIRLDSRGPVLFAQTRLGVSGKEFRCLKFRTMRHDAEVRLRADPALLAQYLENDHKLPASRDPRLTRIGPFLRRTSLDELPQLLNVLRGEMALVGPRPIVPSELDYYGDQADLMLSVRPGMTGAWAVSGRSAIRYPRRAAIELDYVRRWSLRRDVSVLVRTLPAVLGCRGAF